MHANPSDLTSKKAIFLVQPTAPVKPESVLLKRTRKLSFKNSPIVHVYENNNLSHSFDLNTSVDSSEIVSEFLSVKAAPSFKEFENQLSQQERIEPIVEKSKNSMTDEEAMMTVQQDLDEDIIEIEEAPCTPMTPKQRGVGALGKQSASAIDDLLAVLKDRSMSSCFDSTISSLLSMGTDGLKALVGLCTDGTDSDTISHVLTHIANHPVIQQHVILPILIGECNSVDSDRRTAAVGALLKMKDKAAGALSTLVNLLVSGSVSRKLVVKAIKNCGEEGEKMLLFMCQNRNHRIRACVAYILGQRRLETTTLKVIVTTDYSLMFAKPKVIFHRGTEGMHCYVTVFTMLLL